MVFSKAFETLLEAIREGRVTDAHLEAFAADPDRVLDGKEGDVATDGDFLAPPRATLSAEELRRRRAGFSTPVHAGGVPLQRAEYDGDVYVVAGEDVWGPFEAAYDLELADGKPLYRARCEDGWWQVFHGEEASTSYLAITRLLFEDGKPLYVAQLPTKLWCVVHGTTIYRDWASIETDPRIVEGAPLYVAMSGDHCFVAHGNTSWGGHKCSSSQVLHRRLEAGEPLYTVGHELYWGNRRIGWYARVAKVLGSHGGEPVFVAKGFSYEPWSVYFGKRRIAHRVDTLSCRLEGDTLRFIQEYPWPLNLVRIRRERYVPLATSTSLALPAEAGPGPYRKRLPAKTGS